MVATSSNQIERTASRLLQVRLIGRNNSTVTKTQHYVILKFTSEDHHEYSEIRCSQKYQLYGRGPNFANYIISECVFVNILGIFLIICYR